MFSDLLGVLGWYGSALHVDVRGWESMLQNQMGLKLNPVSATSQLGNLCNHAEPQFPSV